VDARTGQGSGGDAASLRCRGCVKKETAKKGMECRGCVKKETTKKGMEQAAVAVFWPPRAGRLHRGQWAPG